MDFYSLKQFQTFINAEKKSLNESEEKEFQDFFFLFHMLSKSNQIKALLFDQINRYLLFSGNVE